MGLKELTAHKHKAAEQTLFMQQLISGTLPKKFWSDFLFQKTSFYSAMEQVSDQLGILEQIPDLRRSQLITLDFEAVRSDQHYTLNDVTVEYTEYLKSLVTDLDSFMAHVYTWHLGDLYGGQLIRSKAPGPCQSLQYSDPRGTADLIRSFVKDAMATEVCKAFEYSIKLMEQYDL
jgi:heme oxygenase